IPSESSGDMLIKVTMVLLDQLLLNSPHYDRLHNRELLTEKTGISFAEYLRIRTKCMDETKKKISFSPLQGVRLVQLFDSAAQFVLSSKFDRIAKVMNKAGLNKENIKSYLSEIDNFNQQMEAMMKGYLDEKLFPMNLNQWASEIK
ncbi:MAG: hypothetical protein WCH34_14365, partial [Bacteroidota bacterium]